ncbi:MAG: DUF1127 domain-containing protein [Reyranellaceae bacterium]
MAITTTDSFLDGADARPAEVSPLARLRSTLRLWRQRTIERSMLAHMTQRDISDMGMTEADVRYEMDKPFWRA